MKRLFLLLLLSFTFTNSSVVEFSDKNFESNIKKQHQKCMNGNSSICSQLAGVYKEHKDYNKTITYYRKACEKNELSACSDLADLYYYGEEIAQDYDKAQQYFEKLCTNEDGYGCYSIGYMHESGDGNLSRDKKKALSYYEKACRIGHEDGCEAIKDLKLEGKNTNLIAAVAIILILLFYIIPIVLHYRQKKLVLKNKESGVIKKVPFLFSLTMYLFGFWVPLLRADFIWFVLSLILSLLTAGLGTVILALFYNKIYIKKLLSKGYEPIDDEAKAILDSQGIEYKLNNSLESKTTNIEKIIEN